MGSASEGTIAVTVSGSGVNASSGAFSTAQKTVTVPSPCGYFLGATGKDSFDSWAGTNWDLGYPPDWYRAEKKAGNNLYGVDLNAHPDDAEGRWAIPSCGPSSDQAERDAFTSTHPPVFVPAGGEFPVPEVSVETLRDVAQDALTLPAPTVDWNPRLDGNAATVVNFDTWVWLEGPTTQFSVTASAGANVATVDATLRDMTLSAPNADGATCVGAGTPWSPGATSDCSIVFTRSSANQPDLKTPLTITTGWDTTWSANDMPQGALDGQVMTSQVGVPVAEVQTIITKN